MATTFPKLVLAMTHAHNAWLVGSAANPENNNPRDYDVVVPYSEWQKACMLIPSDAKPNHFGGWKCISEGKEVDIWPGDVAWLMQRPQTTYVWHLLSGIRWKKMNDNDTK